jgi:hypothetical protein
MWRKRKICLDPVDVEIVRNGFLICEGSTLQYTFLLNKDKNPFKRSLFVPVLYLFKAHKNHPIRVQSSELGRVRLYPDRDSITFLMVPFTEGDFGTAWNKYEIPSGFIPDSGIARDSTLLYTNGGNIHIQDSLTVLRVMPSQVIVYLSGWMYEGRKIISHDKTFDQKLEGRVYVPDQTRGEILPRIAKTLERKYKTRLLFKEY